MTPNNQEVDVPMSERTTAEDLKRGARFWSKVEPNSSGCWIWKACINEYGYGRYRVGKSLHGAHRLSYQHFKGFIPNNLHVMHACDVRNCVNPGHLMIGTNADNMADRDAKGRQAKGVDSHHAVLTESQVVEIRHARGTQDELGKSFGVDPSTIGKIKRGEIWKHVAMLATTPDKEG